MGPQTQREKREKRAAYVRSTMAFPRWKLAVAAAGAAVIGGVMLYKWVSRRGTLGVGSGSVNDDGELEACMLL